MLSVHMLPRTTFSILIVLAMRLAPALGADRFALETRQKWAINAQVLIDELLELSRDVAKTEQEANAITFRGERTGKHKEMMADLVRLTLQSWGIREKADGILWKLWLTTGKVPTPQKKSESLSTNLSRNAREFRVYVTTHATATEEELVRLGLRNGVGSFGSPLWYPTMQYLTEKANVEFECIIFIDVIPRRSIIAQPLNADSYNQLSSALAKWLDANEERMVWDPDAQPVPASQREICRSTGIIGGAADRVT